MRRSGDVGEKEAARRAHDSAKQDVARDLAEKERTRKDKGWRTHADRFQTGRPPWNFYERVETGKIVAALAKGVQAFRRN